MISNCVCHEHVLVFDAGLLHLFFNILLVKKHFCFSFSLFISISFYSLFVLLLGLNYFFLLSMSIRQSLSVTKESLRFKCLSDIVLLSGINCFLKVVIFIKVSKALEASGMLFFTLFFNNFHLFSHTTSITTASSKRMNQSLAMSKYFIGVAII